MCLLMLEWFPSQSYVFTQLKKRFLKMLKYGTENVWSKQSPKKSLQEVWKPINLE